ncbi:unnamed protein product [Closterium sp. NIES-53]
MGVLVLVVTTQEVLEPAAAECGGVSAEGTGGAGGVLEREEQEQLEREEHEKLQQQQQQLQSPSLRQAQQELPNPSRARFLLSPLQFLPVPPDTSLSRSPWSRLAPLQRNVPPEPRPSCYRTNGPFHIVLRSRVPPPPVLPLPPTSSLSMSLAPFSYSLHTSRPDVSRVLLSLVAHLTAPSPSVSAFVADVVDFAPTHGLDYAALLVCGHGHSPSLAGAPAFSMEVLEDR